MTQPAPATIVGKQDQSLAQRGRREVLRGPGNLRRCSSYILQFVFDDAVHLSHDLIAVLCWKLSDLTDHEALHVAQRVGRSFQARAAFSDLSVAEHVDEIVSFDRDSLASGICPGEVGSGIHIVP